mmetsp:Transcript_17649/g.33722  ORF Transcript_17649/g.33722 Transcript_17649/m.33722 type:complete len:304 (+) Transcript_17649:1313-2224(+)
MKWTCNHKPLNHSTVLLGFTIGMVGCMLCLRPYTITIIKPASVIISKHRIQASINRRETQMKHDVLHYQPRKFWSMYDPEVTCPFEERIGDLGDGGKWVCDMGLLHQPCVVFSFGSGGYDSYERELSGRVKCDIHIFDPSPAASGMSTKAMEFGASFHTIGLGKGVASVGMWSKEQSSQESYHLKSLREIVATLNLEGRRINILKIDIEGYEYEALNDILETCNMNIGEIQVELHWVDRNINKHSVTKDHHMALIEKNIHSLFAKFRMCNFYLFSKEYSHDVEGWKAVELAFVNISAISSYTV